MAGSSARRAVKDSASTNMLDGELAATRGAFDHAPDDLGLGGIVFYYYDLVHGIG